MKTIYCPACGSKCHVLHRTDTVNFVVGCPNEHYWSMMVDEEQDRILGFQCEGTSTDDMPEAD